MNLTTATFANSTVLLSLDTTVGVASLGGVFYMILQLTFAAAIVASNLVVVVVIAKTKSLHSTDNALLVSVGVADFLIGFHRIHSLLFEMELIYAPELCQLAYATSIFLCGTSVLHMYLITVKRYVAISDPLHHHNRLTRTRVAVAVVCSWIVALLVGSASYLGHGVPPRLLKSYTYCTTAEVLSLEYLVVGFVLSFFIPGCAITWMYWKIFKIAQHQRRMEKQRVPAAAQAAHRTYMDRNGTPVCRVTSRDMKALRFLSLMLASFIISWLPYFVDSFYTQLCNCPVNKVMYCAAVTLSFGKSLSNPLLYAVGKRDVRRAIFGCVFGKKHEPEHGALVTRL